MSGLLKAGSARLSPVAQAAEPVAPDPAVLRLEARIAALERTVRERDAQLAEARATERSAFAKGEAHGRATADDGVATRLDTLKDSLAEARAALTQTLDGAERLAALLARDCLARLFRDEGSRADTVRDLIRRQMDEIEATAIVAAEVSAEDFPDPDARDRLAAACGLRGVAIVALPEHASGSCTLTLRLGQLDIGLDRQWGRLETLLAGFAEAQS